MEATGQKEITLGDVEREAAHEVQQKDSGPRLQLIIFKLGTEEYSLSIDQIKEVVLTPRIARMPHTPPYIKGVANIRGNIIAILDLEEKFGISREPDRDTDGQQYTLVVESEVFKAGFLVREVPDTLTISAADIDTSSNFIQASTVDEHCIQGVVKSGDRLIILIDTIRLMESVNLSTVINKTLK